jgi:ribonuclease HII
MRDAINNLNIKPDIILVDAVTIPNINIKQEGIIKGDAKSVSIAAASIIAKVTRDNMMKEYNELYAEYEFAKNKGYGTKDHINAIKKYGACPIHRKTFIKSIV